MATRILKRFRDFWRGASGGGQLLDASRNDSGRPDWPVRMESIHRAVNYYDWRTMVSASRRLWANFDVLKNATAQKAMHSVGRGWAPVFRGEDKAWGELARKWLEEQWFPTCDVRGSVFDFRTGLFLDSISFDRDGDNAVILTRTPDGWPQIQRLAAHEIGQYNSSSTIVGEEATTVILNEAGEPVEVDGLYRGLQIELGIIYNDFRRQVALRVIGDFAQPRPQDISARDVDFRFDPEHVDQGRGFPAFSGSINFLASCLVTHQYEQRALQIASALALVESNETGAPDMTDPAMLNQPTSTDATGQFVQQSFEAGMIRYFKASGGGKLEAFKNAARPGAEWDTFNDRIIRTALGGMNWPYSLVWKPEGMNGTQERSCIEQARASVKDRQDLLEPRARRLVGYALVQAMKIGALPAYGGTDPGGFLKWTFEMPPEFSIDHGREDQQARENIKMGLGTVGEFLRSSRGKSDVKAHWREKAVEAALKAQAIAEVEAEFGIKIDPREVQMLTPNDQSQQQMGAADPNADPTPEPAQP